MDYITPISFRTFVEKKMILLWWFPTVPNSQEISIFHLNHSSNWMTLFSLSFWIKGSINNNLSFEELDGLPGLAQNRPVSWGQTEIKSLSLRVLSSGFLNHREQSDSIDFPCALVFFTRQNSAEITINAGDLQSFFRYLPTKLKGR